MILGGTLVTEVKLRSMALDIAREIREELLINEEDYGDTDGELSEEKLDEAVRFVVDNMEDVDDEDAEEEIRSELYHVLEEMLLY